MNHSDLYEYQEEIHDISEVLPKLPPGISPRETLDLFNLALDHIYDPAIYWRQRNRKLIRIDRMSNKHLVNTARMLDRKGLPRTAITAELNQRNLSL